MAQNELVLNENGVIDTSKLNKKVDNSYLQIGIKCKKMKTKDGKKNFLSVKAYMELECYDIDGTYEGFKSRWIDVHFTQDAFDGVDSNCDIKKIDNLQTGTLYVLSKYVQAPTRYQVREEANDEGVIEKIYPAIWIKGGIVGFIPYTPSQNSFNRTIKKHQDAQDAEVEVEPELDEDNLE